MAAGAVEVTLRRPVPLGVALTVERAEGERGDEVRVLDGEAALVAEGRPADPSALAGLEAPQPAVDLAAARAAMAGYRGPEDGPLCECFVCGRGRADAIGVQAGPVAGRDGVVASTWTPPAWTAGADGQVAAEHVWAVLDCPTYFAAYHDAPDPLPLAVLGRFVAPGSTGPSRSARSTWSWRGGSASTAASARPPRPCCRRAARGSRWPARC